MRVASTLPAIAAFPQMPVWWREVLSLAISPISSLRFSRFSDWGSIIERRLPFGKYMGCGFFRSRVCWMRLHLIRTRGVHHLRAIDFIGVEFLVALCRNKIDYITYQESANLIIIC
jgi:hypothetical protein